MNSIIYDVIIIGAGASGLVCARECARRGQKTLVLEKEASAARKILVSGNGRCNLTNSRVSPAYYYGNTELLHSALENFSYQTAYAYFTDLGLLLVEEGLGRVFPATGKSTAVAETLKLAVWEAGAQILTSTEAIRVKKGELFTVTVANGERFAARKLVLACGSCAYPQAGGTQRGYELAKMLGHSVNTPRPALSGICLKETAFSRLTGIRSQVRLTVLENNRVLDCAEGEILFTNYGINGPAALNVSSTVSHTLKHGNVAMEINFFPQLADGTAFLKARAERYTNRKPKDFFAGILHENLANLLIDFIGLRKTIPVGSQTPNTLNQMCRIPCRWPVTATALRPWNEAMVATGGVKTTEINYNTFESLKCPNLYITGELLDVDGKSGGFNLHFACASGFTAAAALSKEN
ncbi:MAG: aminoacetone oxidase family FAD-binding enzyme [Candidatus Avelusimicrobium sp.]|uniref:aminoacetone oxidase family FAD-binding enzyme n=1 Tax=Candidatus Avelusimicrobium sp. TaxID=3048833 RepID=UPI003F0832F3